MGLMWCKKFDHHHDLNKVNKVNKHCFLLRHSTKTEVRKAKTLILAEAFEQKRGPQGQNIDFS